MTSFRATTQKNIDRIHQMVMDDRRLTVNHRVNVMSISRERVETISHQELGMSKVRIDGCSVLTPDRKLTRLDMSEANLAMCEPCPNGFVERFLIQDKCWVHHLNQRPNGNPCCESTRLLFFQRRSRWYHQQRR